MHLSNVVFLDFNKVVALWLSNDYGIRRVVAYPEPLTPLRTTTSPSFTVKLIPDITG